MTPMDENIDEPKPNLLEKFLNTKFVKRWLAFFQTLIDPWVLILLALTIYLSSQLIKQTDQLIVTLLTFLITVFSSILGGILAKRWDDYSEEKVLKTRAQSATRSLNLLLGSIITFEKRVQQYLNRHISPEQEEIISHEVLKTYLEEIVNKCVSLEENVINSIEDWKDILPEMKLSATIKLIRSLNAKADETSVELEKINGVLKETKERTKEEKAKLEADKVKLSKELAEIRKELTENSIKVGIPSLSDSLVSGSTGSFALENGRLIYTGDNPIRIGGPSTLDLINRQYTEADLELTEERLKKKK